MPDKYIPNITAPFTLVFIHGWCLDPESFHSQVAYFKSQYALFLPDYSERIKNTSMTHDLFKLVLSDITNLVIKNKLHNIILIGHSMGGVISLALSQTLSEKIRGCVAIDTTLPATDEKRRLFEAFMNDLKNDEEKLSQFIMRRMFNEHIDDLSLVNTIKEKMLANWREAPEKFLQLLHEAVIAASQNSLLQIKNPFLYIACEPSAGDLISIKQLNPKAQIKHLHSGHFAMENSPDKLNILLSEFIQNIITSWAA